MSSTINVKSAGNAVLYKGDKFYETKITLKRIVQWAELDKFVIFNFHGISSWPKTDTAERIGQSNKIRGVINIFQKPKILCGDFNLAPDTKSMNILESGMNNLIKSFKVKRTRTEGFDYGYSDYIISSSEINIKSMVVPEIEISDHLPLIVDFNL